jgi:hypothetical protein
LPYRPHNGYCLIFMAKTWLSETLVHETAKWGFE